MTDPMTQQRLDEIRADVDLIQNPPNDVLVQHVRKNRFCIRGPGYIVELLAEVERLREANRAEYMNGVKYAIYEIMKEADVYGSQTIRDSGGTEDDMCAQAAKLLTAETERLRAEIDRAAPFLAAHNFPGYSIGRKEG